MDAEGGHACAATANAPEAMSDSNRALLIEAAKELDEHHTYDQHRHRANLPAQLRALAAPSTQAARHIAIDGPEMRAMIAGARAIGFHDAATQAQASAPEALTDAVLELNRAWNAKVSDSQLAGHIDLCRRLALLAAPSTPAGSVKVPANAEEAVMMNLISEANAPERLRAPSSARTDYAALIDELEQEAEFITRYSNSAMDGLLQAAADAIRALAAPSTPAMPDTAPMYLALMAAHEVLGIVNLAPTCRSGASLRAFKLVDQILNAAPSTPAPTDALSDLPLPDLRFHPEYRRGYADALDAARAALAAPSTPKGD
jgi:hypothetical protein